MKRIIIALIMLSIIFTSCVKQDVETLNGDDSEEIYIGVAYPIAENDTNTYLRQGIEFAVESVNTNGGILGKPLNVMWRDDENDGNTALQIAQSFVDSGITAVVGHWGSSICYSVEDIYEENEVLMVMPCATSKSVFDYDYRYIYRMCSDTHTYAEAIAENIAKTGHDKIAICYTDDVYGFDFANNVENELFKRGVTVVDRITNLTNANSEKTGERWKAFGCDGVVVTNVMPSAVDVIRAIRSIDNDYPIWGADNFQRTNFVSTLGKDSLNTYRIENEKTTIDERFLSAFVSKYGHEPDIFAVAGYEAVKLIADSMNTCGTTDSAVVSEYLSQLSSYVSVAGTLTYDGQTQEFVGHKVQVSQVK